MQPASSSRLLREVAMTYHEAIEYIDEHDLQVLILPAHRGFAVYARTDLSATIAIAVAETFEAAVEMVRSRFKPAHATLH
jgi:hypothetical protein